MDACAVVKQLKQLASDTKNRERIVKDHGCLPGLVLFLDNNDFTVVITALETLQLLADCPTNRPIMKKELGMLISLKDIINKSNYNMRAQNLARDVYDTLSTPPSPSPLKETQNTNHGTKPQGKSKGNKNFFVGSTNKRGKVVTLQLMGLCDQTHRTACENELLKVRGVISFTFDLFRKRCILRTKAELKPEILVAAVARTKFVSAEQVIRNELGEEVLLSFGALNCTDKENTEQPNYLPEEDSPIRGLDKAVAHLGQGDQPRPTGWLSTAANFISTSFYW